MIMPAVSIDFTHTNTVPVNLIHCVQGKIASHLSYPDTAPAPVHQDLDSSSEQGRKIFCYVGEDWLLVVLMLLILAGTVYKKIREPHLLHRKDVSGESCSKPHTLLHNISGTVSMLVETARTERTVPFSKCEMPAVLSSDPILVLLDQRGFCGGVGEPILRGDHIITLLSTNRARSDESRPLRTPFPDTP